MPNNIGQLSTILNQLQTDASSSVGDLRTERESFSSVLDEVEAGKLNVQEQVQTVTAAAGNQAMEKYGKFNKLQNKINGAGVFHDIKALFTGQPTTEDMREEQNMLAVETRQIATYEDYQKALLAAEDRRLDTKLAFAGSRMDLVKGKLADSGALMTMLSQGQSLTQTSKTNFIANQYTLAQMKKYVDAGTAPPEYRDDTGLFESIYYEKLRAARSALDTGKDTRTETEKMLASFGNDANAIQAAVETATGGFIEANGQRFDLNMASDFTNKYRENFAKASSLQATQFTGLQNNFSLADQNYTQISGMNRRAPYLNSNPELKSAIAMHQTQYGNFSTYMNNVAQAPVEQQAGALAASAGVLQKMIIGQKALLSESAAVIKSQYDGSPTGDVAAQWATTGEIGSKNMKAVGDFVLGSVMESGTDSTRQAAGGLLFGDVYREFAKEMDLEVGKTITKSGDTSLTDANGRINQAALLEMVLQGKGDKVPSWQITKAVIEKKELDKNGNDVGYYWENKLKNKYAESIMSQSFVALRDSFPQLRPEFDAAFKDAINPVTGLLTVESLDIFVNQLAGLTAELQKTGKLKADEDLLSVYRTLATPANPALGSNVGLEIADPKWNRMMDNADSQIGPGGELLRYMVFKNTERSQVAQAVMSLLDTSRIADKLSDESVKRAYSDALAFKAAATDTYIKSGKGGLTGTKMRELVEQTRAELSKTYSKPIVDKAIEQLTN